MNKKMRELLAAMEARREAAKGFLAEQDTEKAQKAMDELDELEKQYKIAEKLFEMERDKVPDEPEEPKKEKASGFVAISKLLRSERLDDTEKALITGGDSGENYIVPEDVRTAIHELRRSYKSAKELVTVQPVSELSGSMTYESGTPAGLTSFTDGGVIAEEANPTFVLKQFAIEWYAKLIPVSRILKGAEQGGLMGYLNRWFVKNAILTENQAIFSTLKDGKTVKAIKGWEALKKSINTDLDPDVMYDAVIATNQTGFALLDEEKDANGRPILSPDPANPTQKLFQGLPIHIFADRLFPNVGGKAPLLYGSLKGGCTFMDYQGLQFAESDHYLFNKNQSCLRVMEGFDVISTDTEAYIYATFEASPAAAGV